MYSRDAANARGRERDVEQVCLSRGMAAAWAGAAGACKAVICGSEGELLVRRKASGPWEQGTESKCVLVLVLNTSCMLLSRELWLGCAGERKGVSCLDYTELSHDLDVPGSLDISNRTLSRIHWRQRTGFVSRKLSVAIHQTAFRSKNNKWTTKTADQS